MFPIKKKYDTTAAFLDNPNFSIWTNLGYFLTVFFKVLEWLHNFSNYPQNLQNIFDIKKAVMVLNFCLIRDIRSTLKMPSEGVFSNNQPCQYFMERTGFLAHQRYRRLTISYVLIFDGKQHPKSIWFRGC